MKKHYAPDFGNVLTMQLLQAIRPITIEICVAHFRSALPMNALSSWPPRSVCINLHVTGG